MSLSVDWVNKIISVPKTFLQVSQASPTEIRDLNLDAFRLALRELEASADGIPYEETHTHNLPVTVGGVTLARVIEIINGYSVTFENGQYAVNLLGANSNVGDVVNVNQVSVRSANSAGLTFSEEINDQSFTGNFVYINEDIGNPGTQFPRGTPTDPVDNWADAQLIASDRKFSRYNLSGTLLLGSSDDLMKTIWRGESALQSSLVFDGSSVDGSNFERLSITGTASGTASYDRCAFNNYDGFAGFAQNSSVSGVVYLDPGAVVDAVMLNCISSVSGTARPTIDVNGMTAGLQLRGWIGGVHIANATAGNNVSIDVVSGTIEIDETCTDATIVVRGNAELIDNSAGATVIRCGTTPDLVWLRNLPL
jgi:hypothetical protein